MKLDVSKMGALGAAINEMQEVYSKYSEYRPTQLSDMPFYEPMNDLETSLANKEKNKNILLLVFGIVVIIAITVLSYFLSLKVSGLFVMIAIAVLFAGFLVAIIARPVTVLRGTAVLKQVKSSSASGSGSRSYYISFIIESPEKMLGASVPIAKNHFEMVSEGSQVLIVKLGGTYRAVPMN